MYNQKKSAINTMMVRYPEATLPLSLCTSLLKKSRGLWQLIRHGGNREEKRQLQLGWVDNLEWNNWNLDFIKSVMKGI